MSAPDELPRIDPAEWVVGLRAIAQFLGYPGPHAVVWIIYRDELPGAVFLGNQWLVPRITLERWAAEHPVGADGLRRRRR